MKKHDDAVKARVLLEWMAGSSQKALVSKHGVAQSTLRGWLKGKQRVAVAPEAAPKNKATIDDLAYDLVAETLRTLVAIARQAQDPAWLKAQPADGLHLFFGVGADKVIRLYEAINPDRLRAIESERGSGAPGMP